MLKKITTFATIALLLGIAIIHIVWAFNIYWPANSYQEFLNMFWGETDPMPPLWTGIILAMILFDAAFVLYRVAFAKRLPGPNWLWLTGVWALFAVFALRGLIGYLPPFAGELEPYVHLNKIFYSPLCIVIAAGTALSIMRREKPDLD